MKPKTDNAFDIKVAFSSMQPGIPSFSYFSDYVFVLNASMGSLTKAKADELKASIYKIVSEAKTGIPC